MSERVRGAIEIIPTRMAPGLALDISAGDGLSTRMLAERGWRVITTEMRPRRPGWVAVNLNSGLPFRPESFDLVLMLEVVEHLADIPHVLHEIARVLRPGGVAVITTPNRLNVSSRLHHLLSGFYKGRRAPLPYRYRVEDGRNWHVMGLNDFHWMGHGAGLSLDALGRSRRKFKAKLLAPVFYPLIAAYSWMLYVRGEKDSAQRDINRELFRLMTSASCLMDENIVMRFRRDIAGQNGAGIGG
ncbi:MAG TPA: class I SAM-dependent methyltransferase [Candidatus Binataceae bacterium]|nr:class I SAM-dependent methyltransferase [Candidatus Binataceae bacterium]